ncbi:hypothetical protein M1N61_02815 [Peptococcaceae bacterium]|nr:hypothetical protein [Peptococcaceae bacterium]
MLFLDADLEDSVIYAKSLLFPVLMAHADMGIADFIRVNNRSIKSFRWWIISVINYIYVLQI